MEMEMEMLLHIVVHEGQAVAAFSSELDAMHACTRLPGSIINRVRLNALDDNPSMNGFEIH
jgi:hypothetical protein